jgi:hypothetical protein
MSAQIASLSKIPAAVRADKRAKAGVFTEMVAQVAFLVENSTALL